MRAAAQLVEDVFVAVGQLIHGVSGARKVLIHAAAEAGIGLFQGIAFFTQGFGFFCRVLFVALVGAFDDPDENGADEKAERGGNEDGWGHVCS